MLPLQNKKRGRTKAANKHIPSIIIQEKVREINIENEQNLYQKSVWDY